MSKEAFGKVDAKQAREDRGRVFKVVTPTGKVRWYAKMFGVKIRRKTEAGAQATLDLLEAKFQGLTKARIDERAEGPDVLMSPLIRKWFQRARRNWSRATIDEQRIIRDFLIGEVGKYKVYEMSVEILERWMSAMDRRPVGRSRQFKAFMMLRRVLDIGVQQKLIHGNPTRYVKPPRYKATPAEPYTAEEVERLLSGVRRMRDIRQTVWVYAMLMAAFHLGLRPGELRALHWKDIDLAQRVVRVRRGTRFINDCTVEVPLKTRSSMRDLKMTPALAQAFQRLYDLNPHDGYCFTNTRHPLGVRAFTKVWKAAHARAKIRLRRTNTARHTCASLAIEAGASIPDVSRLLGHANPSVTAQVYSHAMDSARQRVADIVAHVYGDSVDEPQD